MTRDIKGELVEFILHNAFYPVLMAQRKGPEKTRIENAQKAARADIERFRNYGSVEEVIFNFKRDLTSAPANAIHSDLKSANMPELYELREKFERKTKELGVNE